MNRRVNQLIKGQQVTIRGDYAKYMNSAFDKGGSVPINNSVVVDAVPPKVIKMGMGQLSEALEADKQAAERAYWGNLLELSGYVRDVMEAGFQNVTVIMTDSLDYKGRTDEPVEIRFSQKSTLWNIREGELVTVRGAYDGTSDWASYAKTRVDLEYVTAVN